MAVRIAIVAVLTAAGALFGWGISDKKLKTAEGLALLAEDIRLLRELTLARLMPIQEALGHMKTEALSKGGRRMHENGALVPEKAIEDMPMPGEAQTAVKTLLRNLSALSRKEHADEYERCIEALSRLEGAFRKDGNEKKRLYTNIGALLALCAGIFLL